MFDLESLWRSAPSDAKVCTVTGATKNQVLSAIMEGVKDFDSLKKVVPLCDDNECAKQNASGRGCRENAEALLAAYVPVYEMMTEGGGCSHLLKNLDAQPKPEGCGGERSSACDGCTLCGE